MIDDKILTLNQEKNAIQKEIEERIEREVRTSCDIFNNENKSEELTLYVVSNMGMFSYSFDLSGKLKEQTGNNHVYFDLDNFEEKILLFNKKLKISNEFKEKLLGIKSLTKEINFDINSLILDTRQESSYTILENPYLKTIKDEKFLGIMASFNTGWAFNTNRQVKIFEASYPFVEYKNGLKVDKGLNRSKFYFDLQFLKNFDYKQVNNITKKLIIESNLFDNCDDLRDCQIKANLIPFKSDFHKTSNNIRNDLKKNIEDSYRIIFTASHFGKPSKIFGIDEKMAYLENVLVYHYNKECLSEDKSLFEDFQNPILKEEKYSYKAISFIEEHKDIDSFKDEFAELSKFTLEIRNLKEDTLYLKEFSSFSDLHKYMKKTDSFATHLKKNLRLLEKDYNPQVIKEIKEIINSEKNEKKIATPENKEEDALSSLVKQFENSQNKEPNSDEQSTYNTKKQTRR